jgi:hypothetical protein
MSSGTGKRSALLRAAHRAKLFNEGLAGQTAQSGAVIEFLDEVCGPIGIDPFNLQPRPGRLGQIDAETFEIFPIVKTPIKGFSRPLPFRGLALSA